MDLLKVDAKAKQHVATLYSSHSGYVQDFIRRKVGSVEIAEDLTQETFIRIMRSKGQEDIQNVRSYLFKIAHNLTIDYFRSNTRNVLSSVKSAVAEVEETVDERVMIEHRAIMRDQIEKIDSSLENMTDLCKEIFRLSRFNGMKNVEIADQLGVCLSTVEKNISKATKYCRYQHVPSFREH